MKKLLLLITLILHCHLASSFELDESQKNLTPLTDEQVAALFKNRDSDCSWEPITQSSVTRRDPQQMLCIVSNAVSGEIERANYIGSFWVSLSIPKNAENVIATFGSNEKLPEDIIKAITSNISHVKPLFSVSEDVKDYRLWVHSCYAGKQPIKINDIRDKTPPWATPVTMASNFIHITSVTLESKKPEQCR